MVKERTPSIILRTVIAVGAAILITSLYLLLSAQDTTKPLVSNDGLSSGVEIGGEFQLTDQNGNIFNRSSLKGKLSLIYFGFTSCPDICPTALNKITEALSTLEKYQIAITPVFITIDPERDTEKILKNYLNYFHQKFIGLTGSAEQIKEVADKFKVYYAKSAMNESENKNYMMDHSSFIYLLDENGQYLKHFYLATEPKEIIEFIRINHNAQKLKK